MPTPGLALSERKRYRMAKAPKKASAAETGQPVVEEVKVAEPVAEPVAATVKEKKAKGKKDEGEGKQKEKTGKKEKGSKKK